MLSMVHCARIVTALKWTLSSVACRPTFMTYRYDYLDEVILRYI